MPRETLQRVDDCDPSGQIAERLAGLANAICGKVLGSRDANAEPTPAIHERQQ